MQLVFGGRLAAGEEEGGKRGKERKERGGDEKGSSVSHFFFYNLTTDCYSTPVRRAFGCQWSLIRS